MKILIRPQVFTGCKSWQSKLDGVILVEKQEDIEPLWKLLCEQDDYWESYKNLIKVSPKEIDSIGEIAGMCQYCGKTDIYDPESIQKIVPFIMYQTYEYHES